MVIQKQGNLKLGASCLLGLSALGIIGNVSSYQESRVISGSEGNFQEEAIPIKITQEEIEEIARASQVQVRITKGYRRYAELYYQGKELPAEKYIPLFVKATEGYEIFKKNPYLLPAITIVETSAGLNITRENNILNWGARIQKAGNFSPASFEEAIEKAVTAIGGEKSRGRQATYYQKFRDSNDLADFCERWENNGEFYRRLKIALKFFEEGGESI